MQRRYDYVYPRVHLDLNLLTVLEALVEEGSVAGAASRLRLSSPAVSRSLGRIGASPATRSGAHRADDDPDPVRPRVQDQIGDLLRQAGQLLAPSAPLDSRRWSGSSPCARTTR